MALWLLVLAVLTLGAYGGYKRGLPTVVGTLIGLVIGLVVASLSYHFIGRQLGGLLGIPVSLASVFSYLLVLMLVQFAVLLAVRAVVVRLPKKSSQSRLMRGAGAAVALVETAVIVGVTLAVLASLPATRAAADDLKGRPLTGQLMILGGRLQQIGGGLPGGDISDTLNLMTVDPESQKSLKLGFKTTEVQVDQNQEQQMLIMINNERRGRGLQALALNEGARKAGRQHCSDMFARGYFSHLTPEGSSPFDRLKAVGVKFGAAGENIALAPSLAQAHQGLMDSPGHRANILSTNYKKVGIGVITNPVYGNMYCQEFTD